MHDDATVEMTDEPPLTEIEKAELAEIEEAERQRMETLLDSLAASCTGWHTIKWRLAR